MVAPRAWPEHAESFRRAEQREASGSRGFVCILCKLPQVCHLGVLPLSAHCLGSKEVDLVRLRLYVYSVCFVRVLQCCCAKKHQNESTVVDIKNARVQAPSRLPAQSICCTLPSSWTTASSRHSRRPCLASILLIFIAPICVEPRGGGAMSLPSCRLAGNKDITCSSYLH